MAKQTTVSEDADNARRLEEHARNILATNQRHPQRSWFDLPWPIVLMTMIGGVFTIAVALVLLWPLAVISHKYYFG